MAIKSTAATALDVAGGAEFGSGNVPLIGTDGKINGPLSTTILDDLSGANLTGLNGSQITTGTVAAGRIANLSAAKITSGKLARARLAFGTFDVTGNTSTVATLNDYSFFPNIRGCTASDVTLKGRGASNPTENNRTGAVYVVLDGACQGGAT